MPFTTGIKCGGYNILYTPTGGIETNLGSTQEGSNLFVIPSTFERMIHRYGTNPHDEKSTGFDIRLEAIFLQQDFINFKTLLSQGKITSGGSVAADTLDGEIDDVVTVLTLTTFTGFENPPETGYVIRIEDEDILVRASYLATKTLGSTEYPCERGYNGTIAVTHATITAVTLLDTVIDLDVRPQSLTKGNLILRPVGLILESGDDVNIFKASIKPNLTPVYRIDQDQAFAAIFKGLIDENGLGQIRQLRFGKASVEPTQAYFPQV